MKKIYFLLLAFSFFTIANAQIVNIPDANFKAKLLAANTTNSIAKNLLGVNFKIDANSDGEIQETEALQVSNLAVNLSKIASLVGIEKFINLQTLDCNSNQLTSINLLTLQNLQTLNCNSNQLTSIDVITLQNLKSLACSNNQLTTLNLSGLTNLNSIFCPANQISTLDVGNLTNLKYLSCSSNQLTYLDVSILLNLQQLECSKNRISTLDVSSLVDLRDLQCSSNSISILDVSKLIKLYGLDCRDNQISILDITNLTRLTTLWCRNNLIQTLNFSTSNQGEFYCHNNKLETIFIKNGAVNDRFYFKDNPTLKYICCDESEIDYIQYDINDYGYTNCVVNSYCSFIPGGTFYTIQGNQKLDSNNNGCDANDIPISNFKYSIADGTTTGSFISDGSGNYSIPVQAGTYTITPKLENPTYFTVSPTTVNVTFPTQTSSPFSQNFCIAPNGVRPDLEVTLLPLQPARPGFDAKYKIVYKNKGNTIQSGIINLSFIDSVLDLVVANPLASSQTMNTLSWNFTSLQPFETREITFTMNVNSPMETPAVNIGNILAYTATITSVAIDETPTDNTFTFNQTVVGSYDPNDKTCLEGSVITPALIGQYVHYTIRFENTGTFAATNVVVKDIIDLTKFDISTLIPTSASHSFVTKISEGNKVEFIFENINLPFDDASNDGYIAFKIKTKLTLVVNDSFTNEANIYFDYNFPILTNKATSTFKTLGTQDFDFARYFTVYPNPAKAYLNITAKETINVKSISVYNTLGQLVLVVTNADKASKIDVSSLKSGNYFVQIKTDKGSSSAQFIKE